MAEKNIRMAANHPCLCQYDWPGNVRELRNFMERFAALSPSFPDRASLLVSLFSPRDSTEDPAAGDIVRALRETGGNRAAAARKLGISRSTLWRKLKRPGTPFSATAPDNRDR